MCRGPESNRHEVALIGVWDRRVYQFRHPGMEEYTQYLYFVEEKINIIIIT